MQKEYTMRRRLTSRRFTEDDERHFAKMTPAQRRIEEAIQILRIPLDEERTHGHIDTLRTALQVNLQKMQLGKGKEISTIVLQKLYHEVHSPDSVVFHAGEMAKAFYMIIRGSVGVYVKVPKKKSPGTEDEPQKFDWAEVNVLHAGTNFGELAILNDSTRSATIMCKEKTDFAVLSAEDFKQVTAAREEWRVNKNVKFLKQSVLLNDISSRLISTMIYQIKILELNRNQFLFKEGDESTHIYIIKKGEILLQKEIDIKIEEDIFHPVNELLKPKHFVKKKVEVAILGPKESCGEEEVFLNKKRQVSAICASESAKIFAIDLVNFTERIRNLRDYEKFFEEHCQNKIAARNERLEAISSVKDQKKGLLYGRSTTDMQATTQIRSSRPKLHQSKPQTPSQSRKASPMKQLNKTATQAEVLENTTKPTISKSIPLITVVEIKPSEPHIHRTTSQIRPKSKVSSRNDLSPRQAQNESFALYAREPKRPSITPEKSPLVKVHQRHPSQKKTDTSLVLDKVGSIQTAVARVLLRPELTGSKKEKNPPTAENKNPTTPDYNRRHISNKPQKFIREEQMLFYGLEAKEKIFEKTGGPLKEQTLADNFSFYNDSDKLSKNPKYKLQLLKDHERRPTSSYARPPFGELTVSQRVQTHQRTLSISKAEEPPKPTKNIHVDRMRGYTNMSRIFKTQAKILNHISTEATTLSHERQERARTAIHPNLSLLHLIDPNHSNQKLDFSMNVNSENDLFAHRDDANVSSDQLMVIQRLVSSRTNTRRASRL